MVKKYPVVNFKSPILYIGLLIILAISALPMLIMIKSDNFWLNEVAFIPILIAVALPIYSLTSKVVVGDTFITKKTIFGTRSVKLEDIKSFGVMKQEGELGIRIIEESEFKTTDWFFPKIIFISKDQDYDPLSYKQKGTIKFHYQKDLYIDIKHKIANCKHSRYR
jgi:hypothetical protein